jgi:hypothetical protein
MTLDEILLLLEKVNGRGDKFTALCPAHDDKSPSLSVKAGDQAILLRCWSGCTLPEICAALGIKVADLFYDNGVTHFDREAIHRREREKEKAKKIEVAGDRGIDLLREAEATIKAATGIDISAWTADQLDQALNALAPAHKIIFDEEIKKYVE